MDRVAFSVMTDQDPGATRDGLRTVPSLETLLVDRAG